MFNQPSAAHRGDRAAAEALLPLMYDELRRLAGHLLMHGGRPAGATLQPTALVNEACVKLLKQTQLSVENRDHLFAVAAMAMRQVLSNSARARRAEKRGGPGTGRNDGPGGTEGVWARRQQVTLSGVADGPREVDLLALDDVLAKLERLDPRQARLVELRFLGGMTMEAAAGILGISLSSCEREWRAARAFLLSELGADPPAGGPSGAASEADR